MGECPDFEEDRSNRCRCQNTTDPQKIFSYVLQAIRHWDCGNGATFAEIRCYIMKNHRVCMSEQELSCAIKESLTKAICLGAIRRRYCDQKYYMCKMSSGRCRRLPPACVEKCPPPCRKPKCPPPDDDECDDAPALRDEQNCSPSSNNRMSKSPKLSRSPRCSKF